MATGVRDMINLSLGTLDHDRVMGLHDGRVTVPGVSLDCEVHPTSGNFPEIKGMRITAFRDCDAAKRP